MGLAEFLSCASGSTIITKLLKKNRQLGGYRIQ